VADRKQPRPVPTDQVKPIPPPAPPPKVGWCADAAARERALGAALRQLRIDANRLCDRMLGGSYEQDCRLAIKVADAALALPTVPATFDGLNQTFQPKRSCEGAALVKGACPRCGIEGASAESAMDPRCLSHAALPVPALTTQERQLVERGLEVLAEECGNMGESASDIYALLDKCRAHAAALKEGTVAEAAPTYEVLPSRGDGAELEVNGESIALFDPSPMGDALADLVLTLLTAHADEQDRQGHVRRFNATTAPTDEALLELWRDWWRTLGTCRGETPALRAAAEAAYRDAVNAAKETKP